MKLNFSLFYSISLVLAQAKNGAFPEKCYTKLNCKFSEVGENEELSNTYDKCINENYEDEAENLKCTLKVLSLNTKQVEFLKYITPSMIQCNPKIETKMIKCADDCIAIVNGDCFQKCGEIYQLIQGTCLAKLANKPNFDVKKSIQCANSCNQATLSEVIDCDYNCKRELYDYLINKSKAEALEKPMNPANQNSKGNTGNKNTDSDEFENDEYEEGNSSNKDSNQSNSSNTKSSGDSSSKDNSNRSNSTNTSLNEDKSTTKDSKPSVTPQSGSPGHSGTRLSFDNIPLYKLLLTIAFSVLI